MADTPKSPRPPGSYEIGYGKPPKHTQFKPGAKPPKGSGRPRKTESPARIFQEEFDEKLSIPDRNGRRTRMSTMRAFFKQLKRDALMGDKFAKREVLRLIRDFFPPGQGALLTEAEMRAQANDQAEREAAAAKLSAAINDHLEFISEAIKAGMMERGTDGAPHLSRLGYAMGDYVYGRSNRSAEQEDEARTKMIDAMDLARASRGGARPTFDA